ncbi:hypothetical protein PRK78_006385 [Emydomyces testavorans]|uniref:Uncharacterized protein n=1 Tax=Emydomyces testavorans TaxID=2070801 RepID=A0AAF0ILL2_9EURO|nr:hypothetical protein PRK78_006385 [Emydomyces testavorans]
MTQPPRTTIPHKLKRAFSLLTRAARSKRSNNPRIKPNPTAHHNHNHNHDRDPRYEPCDTLIHHGIPCRVWCEDVLAVYGVPTVVFDLFVLVPDPDEAAETLVAKAGGYVRTQANPRYARIPQLSREAPRLVRAVSSASEAGGAESESGLGLSRSLSSSSGSGSSKAKSGFAEYEQADDVEAVGVVLLSATEWGYELPADGVDYLVPDLWEYLDCIVAIWLDLDEGHREFRDHLGIHIGYCSTYVDEVWTPEFFGMIRREHRHLLFELLASRVGHEGVGPAQLLKPEYQQYHRRIRDQIRAGEHHPVGIETFNWTRPKHGGIGTSIVAN